jgi:hypothetical protein
MLDLQFVKGYVMTDLSKEQVFVIAFNYYKLLLLNNANTRRGIHRFLCASG